MSSQLRILRAYAKLDDASIAAKKLPPTVYFSHTRHTLTIFDAYPKALFHFLILPRLQTASSTAAAAPITLAADDGKEGDDGDGDDKGERRDADADLDATSSLANSETDLTSLRTLLRSATTTTTTTTSTSSSEGAKTKAKARARGTLRILADEATRLQGEIEREMRARYDGFAWPIWVGFHTVPSMEHLHLHVVSSDLTAEALKTKKHYNSFSPRVGFFLPLAEVRAWFEDKNPDDDDDDGDRLLVRVMARLAPEKWEPRLKDALVCFHCGETVKNMPALKKHLQEEFDTLRKREVGKLKRKRETSVGSPELDEDKQIGKTTRVL